MKYVTPLTASEIHTLHEMQRAHPVRRARMRAHSILLSHQGSSIPPIARVYEVDRRSVSSWVDRWQQEGLVGLYDRPHTGRPHSLSARADQSPAVTAEISAQHQTGRGEPCLLCPGTNSSRSVSVLCRDTIPRCARVSGNGTPDEAQREAAF
jgi:transposase-like protein